MRVISCLNKMWLCFSLVLFSVSALAVVFPASANAEAMSWNPRTPAGGREFIDPNFFLRVAGVVEWGSLSIFNTAAEVEITTTTTAEGEIIQGESRVYSPIGRFGVTLEGELVLIDSDGNPMQKGPTQSLAFDNSISQYFYFSPQMTSSTTTVTQKSKPKKNP
jgi:hypothetical protein